MSAMGSCADNATAEDFFGMLKRERVNRRQYRTQAEARADIFDYIKCRHNPRQLRGNGAAPINSQISCESNARSG